MDVEIREATKSDIPEIQEVAEKSWHAAHDPIVGEDTVEDFLDEHYNTERLEEIIEHESPYFVAEDDNQVLGFVAGGPDNQEDGLHWLGAIYVDPEYWGKGIGGRLVDRFESEVRERGFESLRLKVMKENRGSKKFYESKGFKEKREEYNDDLEIYDSVYEKEL